MLEAETSILPFTKKSNDDKKLVLNNVCLTKETKIHA